jgi:hypothetical protein
MAGTREAVLDQFGDLLNASANKIKKTKVAMSFRKARTVLKKLEIVCRLIFEVRMP